jgi:hypothetical protein
MRWNGNITLNPSGNSQIENLVVERLTTLPTFDAAEKGRLVFNTTDGKLYVNTGVSFIGIASGGDASAIQVELDNLESALGSLITAAGAFSNASVTFSAIDNASTNLTQVLTKLDTAIATKPSSLATASDVTLTSVANKDILYYDNASSKWKNGQPGAVTGVQTYSANLAAIGALALSANGFVSVNSAGTAYEMKSPTSVVSALGLVIGTNTQAYSRKLDQLSSLTQTTNNFVIGNGSSFVMATPATARTALGLGTAALNNTGDFLLTTGGTLNGNVTVAATYAITQSTAPTNASHLVNKAYVDGLVSGLSAGYVWMAPVVAVLATQPGTTTGYNEGDLILCTTPNKVFKVVSSSWVDQSIAITDGSTLFEKSTDFQWMYNGTAWVNISPANVITNGAGLSKTSNVLSVNFGAGTVNNAGALMVNVYSTGGIILTTDGSTSSTVAAASLAIKLNGTTLALSASGLKVNSSGITATELASSVAGNGLQGGAGTALSVKAGTSVAGSAVAVSVAAGGVTVPVGTTVGTVSEGNHNHAFSTVSGISLTSPVVDQNLVYDGTNWVNKSTYYLYTGAAATSHTITHGLGKQYVNVTVIETATDEQIIPQSVKFNSTTVVVTLNVATAIKVVCTI